MEVDVRAKRFSEFAFAAFFSSSSSSLMRSICSADKLNYFLQALCISGKDTSSNIPSACHTQKMGGRLSPVAYKRSNPAATR